MARLIGKLSAAFVKKTTRKGLFADGGGLYLHVNERGAKSWTFRFMLRGRAREWASDRCTPCPSQRPVIGPQNVAPFACRVSTRLSIG
jgi:Arm DNA-binding domain